MDDYIMGVIAAILLVAIVYTGQTDGKNRGVIQTTTKICSEIQWQSPTCAKEKSARLKDAGL